ncbi:hypothetical protein D0867_10550 [Hortaea werneckii]|uniref:DUF1279 domain-containing protein n=1 Tax=Hortaea werneckii TaxID=91943 RepID=A0A3M7B376_HORWE|nr:hypothetical protein D0867_10550 [Hortaea werneckii]RMY34242.1 hypothetical protein D0866_05379 [Hortaea werneckii]
MLAVSRHSLLIRDCLLRQTRSCLNKPLNNFQTRRYVLPQTPLRRSAQSRASFCPTSWSRPSPSRRFRGIRHNSNQASKGAQEQTAQQKSQQPPQGLSARFKDLSRRYGWAALGVYMGLSALDFPFCFMAVRWLGTDRIAHAEHLIAEGFWSAAGMAGLDYRSKKEQDEPAPATGTAAGIKAGRSIAEDWGGKGEKGHASIWTQLLLAYGVHKSLIFFRVPLTAAVTPRIVKWLRSRGWNIGRQNVK